MNEARQQILTAIARHKRADSAPPIARPAPRAGLSRDEAAALFKTKALESAATVDWIDDPVELPAAVQRYLSDRDQTVDNRALYVNSASLSTLDWQGVEDSAPVDAPVCVTEAFCGIAESGSVMLVTGAGVSSAAWFLAETLIVVLCDTDIVSTQAAAWLRLRDGYEKMPRTATLVTGPSRTGDIEQKLVIGAHGPCSVHLVLYGQ